MGEIREKDIWAPVVAFKILHIKELLVSFGSLKFKGMQAIYIWSWDSADGLSQNNLIFTKIIKTQKENKTKKHEINQPAIKAS